MDEAGINLRAYAKLNLALAVGPPEPATAAKPGFHRIASWFACVDLDDDLTLSRTDGKSEYIIEWAADAPRTSPIDWPTEKDLAVRAHKALESHAGKPLAIRMHLAKRTPVGGGLGGGSSDAAAMLKGVNALHDLKLGRDQLATIAQTLGSDIAFFLDDRAELDAPARPALVGGFGDQIERVGAVAAGAVLFFPEFGCPTGAVYKAFDALMPGPLREDAVRELITIVAEGGPLNPANLFNDLAAAAEAVEPRLRDLRRALARELGVPVHVTGSGSTLFAIGSDQHHARRLRDQAMAKHDQVVAVATRLL